MKLFEVTEAKKRMCQKTFQPYLQLKVNLPYEFFDDIQGTGLSKQALHEEFFNLVIGELKTAKENADSIINTYIIKPDFKDGEYLIRDINCKVILIPQTWVPMKQLLAPRFKTNFQEAKEVATISTKVRFKYKEYTGIATPDFQRKFIDSLENLMDKGYRYFYEGSLQLVIDGENEYYELFVRVA